MQIALGQFKTLEFLGEKNKPKIKESLLLKCVISVILQQGALDAQWEEIILRVMENIIF